MNNGGRETERKYLIRMPEASFLNGGEVWEIRQTYLVAGRGNRRVRAVVCRGEMRYFYTEKERVSALTSIEREREIDGDTYRAYLSEARPDSAEVVKTRYRIPYAGHTLEIDVYPFWRDTAVLEVELAWEGDRAELPSAVTVLREVTEEPLYKNTNIARFLKEHPGEPLPI